MYRSSRLGVGAVVPDSRTRDSNAVRFLQKTSKPEVSMGIAEDHKNILSYQNLRDLRGQYENGVP